MPLWAKIDVGMRNHPKLVGRPDADRLLWVCLILHAKEHAPEDGIVRDLDAAAMRSLWCIKAPVKAVASAIDYFIAKDMVQRTPHGLLLVDFIERQGAFDREEQRKEWRERKQRQRTRERGADGNDSDEPRDGHVASDGDIRDKSPMSHRDTTGQVTPVPPLEVEVEVEEEKEHGEEQRRRSQASQPSGHPPPLPTFSDAWPKDLVDQLVSRVSASWESWEQFLTEAMKFPRRRRDAALLEFLRRGCPERGKGPSYLLGMIREGAGNPGPVPVPVDRRPVWEREGYASLEDYEAAATQRTQEALNA